MHERIPTTQSHFNAPNQNMLYATNPYSDSSGYLQMALGAYLTPSGGGYKSVDPYFLSQGIYFIILFNLSSFPNIL